MTDIALFTSIPFYTPHIDDTPAYCSSIGNESDTLAMHDPIEKVRCKGDFTLDAAGSQLYHHPAKDVAVTSEDVKREYSPESISPVKESARTSRVVLFDHCVYLFLGCSMKHED